MATTTTPTTFSSTAALKVNGTSTLTQRTAALATSTDLVQAGATFNDATRLLDGGLWSTPNDNHNQPAYLGMYTSDITAVLNDVTAMLAQGAVVTAGGPTHTVTLSTTGMAGLTGNTTGDVGVLGQIQTQLNTLLHDAPLSVGTSSAAIAAQNEIHTTQLSIISEIQGDTNLANAINAVTYTTGTGALNTGFQALPTADTNTADATAAGATLGLQGIGGVFNDAADTAVGGLNSSNIAHFGADIQAVAQGVQNILNSPTQLAAIEANETNSRRRRSDDDPPADHRERTQSPDQHGRSAFLDQSQCRGARDQR